MDDTITFDVGFAFQRRHAGTFVDDQGIEHFYFAEPVTHKQLKVFSLEGKYERTIPLDSALFVIDEIQGIAVAGADSILLSAPFTGEVVCLDGHGSVRHVFTVGDQFRADSLTSFEPTAPGWSDFLLGDGWVFRAGWWFDDLERAKQEKGWDQPTYLRAYYARSRYAPCMVRIRPSAAGEERITLGPDSFYTELLDTTEVFDISEHLNVHRTPKGTFYFSWFSPTIFEIDSVTFDLRRSATVRSALTDIGVPPVTIERSLADEHAHAEALETHGALGQVAFDPRSGNLVVLVMHAGKKGGPWHQRPFSLVVLDQQLGPKAEVVVPSSAYVPLTLISSRHGLYLERASGAPERATVHTFDRIAL